MLSYVATCRSTSRRVTAYNMPRCMLHGRCTLMCCIGWGARCVWCCKQSGNLATVVRCSAHPYRTLGCFHRKSLQSRHSVRMPRGPSVLCTIAADAAHPLPVQYKRGLYAATRLDFDAAGKHFAASIAARPRQTATRLTRGMACATRARGRQRCGQRAKPFLMNRGAARRGVAWRGVAWRGVAWRGVAFVVLHAAPRRLHVG